MSDDAQPVVQIDTDYGPIRVKFTGLNKERPNQELCHRAWVTIGYLHAKASDGPDVPGLVWKGHEVTGSTIVEFPDSGWRHVYGYESFTDRKTGNQPGPATVRAVREVMLTAVSGYVAEHPEVLWQARAIQLGDQQGKLIAERDALNERIATLGRQMENASLKATMTRLDES